jgi:hypothetical protein
LLADLGVQSIDDLKLAIETIRSKPDSDGEPDQPKKDSDKLLRSLREERKALQKELEQAKADNARFSSQATRALTADIQSRLLAAGAHGDAVADLVKLVSPHLGWSEDGTEIEVVERDGSGNAMPSWLTIDELIEEQKTKRPWFFSGRIKVGAGSNPGAAQQEPQQEGYDFRRAFDAWTRRRV